MASPTATKNEEQDLRQRPTPGVGATPEERRGLERVFPPAASTAGVGTLPAGGVGMLPHTEDGLPGHNDMAPLGRLRPVLFDNLDGVLLLRLYPNARNSDEARQWAMEAGEAAAKLGEHMEASMHEPVRTEDGNMHRDNPDAVIRDDDNNARGRGTHRARNGDNDPPEVTGGRQIAEHPAGHSGSGVHTPPQQSTSTSDKDDKKNDKK